MIGATGTDEYVKFGDEAAQCRRFSLHQDRQMSHALDDLQQKQIRQAEELLFSGPQKAGFAKELFFGRFLTDAILPYPRLSQADQAVGDAAVEETRRFVTDHIDPVAIDRNADIPPDVIRGLARIG